MMEGRASRAIAAGLLLAMLAQGERLQAWGAQGHRVVAAVAWAHLGVAARTQVASLLERQSLASVADWADDIRDDEPRTVPWHYVNLPLDATRYDRDRDCPRSSGRDDGSRDCVVDRVLDMERQLTVVSLDRAQRARVLKFLVHLVGDLHQPLHTLGVARGGNDIPVSVFGSNDCGVAGRGGRRVCTLHGAWDSTAVARRRLNDAAWTTRLEGAITSNQWRAGPIAPQDWALESNRIAGRLLVPARTNLDEAYFRSFDRELDERLAKAGLRLAAMLNRVFG